MDILVLGGTRFMGVHLVKYLLVAGYQVTIATRGKTPDKFGDQVHRITLDRDSADSIAHALKDRSFDVVYDSNAYCSNHVKYLLDVVKCKRYIAISSLSVYPQIKNQLVEADFDPISYPLKWCGREDFTYDEIKRQAESAIFQAYPHLPSVAVRFPYVIGKDDYTKRLYFYVEHVVKSIPMYVDNLDEKMAFVHSCEAGEFLSWLADQAFYGTINAASDGQVSLLEIIQYVEDKVGKRAIFSEDGKRAPYNGTPAYSMDLGKAEAIGFAFSKLDTWLYALLDAHIAEAQK